MGNSIFMKRLRKLEDIIMISGMSIIMILVLNNVFMRYIIKSGFLWGEELIGFCIVGTVMIGAARALKEKQHLSLIYFLEKTPPWMRVVIGYVIDILMLLMIVTVFYSGIVYARGALGQMSFILRIPMVIPYSFLPVGMLCIFLELIASIYDKTVLLLGAVKIDE